MTVSLIISLIAIGICAGALSAFVGVGGGIIIVPALVFFLNYTQHQAQGTSLGVLSFPVVLVSFLIYYSKLKHTDHPISFQVILIIAIGFIIGSIIASKVALSVDQKLLKKLFAILLFYTAIKMLEWDKAVFKIFQR
jgi:uncharacterized protein